MYAMFCSSIKKKQHFLDVEAKKRIFSNPRVSYFFYFLFFFVIKYLYLFSFLFPLSHLHTYITITNFMIKRRATHYASPTCSFYLRPYPHIQFSRNTLFYGALDPLEQGTDSLKKKLFFLHLKKFEHRETLIPAFELA